MTQDLLSRFSMVPPRGVTAEIPFVESLVLLKLRPKIKTEGYTGSVHSGRERDPY